MINKVRHLYPQFQPENYNLTITISPNLDKFSGEVDIVGIKSGRPSKRITFHQKDLQIESATVTRLDKNGAQDFAVIRINNHKKYDEVRLHAQEMLYPGKYTVHIKFSSNITRPMNGIYPCFFEHNGEQKQLIATQFESHHAREAFPCIDEPEAKATFDLSLITPNVRTIIANTPVLKQVIKTDVTTTRFESTPRMSTYLLAFCFGDLDSLEATTKDGVLVRTFATPDNIQHTKFALDCAVKTLEFYNQYFDIAYPLPKCDFIALPDFASGAMENWGCITFREQALLVDPKNTSLHLKQYVANVVAHELTHQWFGNLVTMKWWNDLWLNESFASWMSYLAVDEIFPDWKVWTQFIVDEQSLALKLDALENTHPIQVAIHHPDEIRTIFDAISYEKGASVLNMLHKYLGADDFRNGLRLYLKKHAYGNTDSTDLWAALENVSKKPVTEFMSSWTTTPGYPIVYADVTNSNITLDQERFYLNPTADKDDMFWPIPLGIASVADDQTMTTKTFTLPDGTDGNNLILNSGRTSFYRAAYSANHLKIMAPAISGLPELDRMGILADSFEASKAGYTPTVDSLGLLSSYAHEHSPVVWDIIAGNLGSIRVVMDDDSIRENMRAYCRTIVAEQYLRLGWKEIKDESHFDKLLRPTILGLACFAELPDAVITAKGLFKTSKTTSDIHPDVRGVVYGTVSRLGNSKEYDKLLQLYVESKNSEDRVTLAASLTNFEQPELINKALAMITSDQVRLQDAPYWIAYSFMNRHAQRTTWEWMTKNWNWLESNLGNDLSFYRMPIYAARAFSDLKILPEFESFFAAHLSPAFERNIKQAIETIQWQAAWKQRDLAALQTFFASQLK